MDTVYAVLVAYNPEHNDLKNAVELLLRQVTKVVVCNNSTNGYKYAENSSGDVKIFNFNDNLGIAEAQSIGMKWAFENGADFILQMDQDSIPDPKMVEQLLTCYKKLLKQNVNVGLVGSQDFDKVTGELNKARVKKGKPLTEFYYEVDSTLSSGSLIPKNSWLIVGGMKDELFIDAVDHEYCWRLRAAGFKVIRNKNALLAHRLGDGRFKILNILSVGLPSPFRHYYATRNIFLLLNKKYVPIYWKISSLVKLIGKVFLYPIFLPNGNKRLYFFLKGINDGLMGRSGKMK
ncbi:glycosyltransferase family 2 protein [Escherichia coli]